MWSYRKTLSNPSGIGADSNAEIVQRFPMKFLRMSQLGAAGGPINPDYPGNLYGILQSILLQAGEPSKSTSTPQQGSGQFFLVEKWQILHLSPIDR